VDRLFIERAKSNPDVATQSKKRESISTITLNQSMIRTRMRMQKAEIRALRSNPDRIHNPGGLAAAYPKRVSGERIRSSEE
jgi:hypothetical protein